MDLQSLGIGVSGDVLHDRLGGRYDCPFAARVVGRPSQQVSSFLSRRELLLFLDLFPFSSGQMTRNLDVDRPHWEDLDDA